MIKAILNGIKAYFNAFEIISRLKLWKFFMIPILISVFAALIIGSTTFFLADDIGGYIKNIWPWEFGSSTFEVISTFFSGLFILAVGLILYKHIVIALSSPFMSPVSERIEADILGKSPEKTASFSTQLARGIKVSIRNIVRELSLTIFVLLIGFLPVIGLLSSIGIFLIQAYYAGFGNMDYTLERYFGYKESIQFVKKNKGIAIGNGIVFMLLLLIPVIGVIIVFPLSVTAATTETIKKIHGKEVIE